MLVVLREWLSEANRISYESGGTYASVLVEALENLEKKEGDGAEASS